MDAFGTVSSDGRVTLPEAVREALGIESGDRVLFRVGEQHATLERVPDFLALAGSVDVPPEKRGASWEEVLAHTQRAWAESAMRGLDAPDA